MNLVWLIYVIFSLIIVFSFLFLSLFILSGQTLDALLLELTAFSWTLVKTWFEDNFLRLVKNYLFEKRKLKSHSFSQALKYFSKQNNPSKFTCPSVIRTVSWGSFKNGKPNWYVRFGSQIFCWVIFTFFSPFQFLD